MRVVGLDLSLSGSAAVCHGVKGVRAYRLCSNEKELFLEERIDLIQKELMSFIKEQRPELVVIESGARGGKFVDLNIYHLAGVIRWKLWRRKQLIYLVPPTHLKKVATGNGRADKKMMLAAARDLWPECPDHNTADAFHLAKLGHDEYRTLVTPA